MCRPKTGIAAAIITAAASTRLITGRRSTAWTIAVQNRLSAPPPPTNGIRSAFTRSPSSPSSAGRSVSAANTETTPTMIAPAARLRMIVVGTISIPKSATTNAVPLKSTARLAVAPVIAIASSFDRPRARSSR